MAKKEEARFFHYVSLYFPLMAVFVLDRLTKNLALDFIEPSSNYVLIPNLLSLTLVFNQGIAFGILSKYGNILALGISILLLLILLLIHNIPKKYYIPFGLILGGAFGNVFDRFLYYDGVIDFLSIPFFSVFNLADIAITCGIIYLIFCVFLDETKKTIKERKLATKSKL